MSQIGIPNYKDIFNKEKVSNLNDLVTALNIYYSKLINKQSIDNRESDKVEVYIKQYEDDIYNLKKVRELATQLSDFCNEGIFKISLNSVYNHSILK